MSGHAASDNDVVQRSQDRAGSRSCSTRSELNCTKFTLTSSWTGGSSHSGVSSTKRDRPSASNKVLPGWYLIVTPYFLQTEQHPLQTWWCSVKILELNHLQRLVIRLDDKGFAVQVRVEAFTCVDNRNTFTLDVGVSGFCVSKRFTGKCDRT